ncbi:unnamed protein product [Heligmosomoides polygyrus]|uniref:Uncharacterized protein n=1 Tax=Heligmosomoides polygyrus TaxID=6339 RepID=A0A183GS76_HELPZ|nr:unnamed protein product [Heligmosomoides polygyrus]
MSVSHEHHFLRVARRHWGDGSSPQLHAHWERTPLPSAEFTADSLASLRETQTSKNLGRDAPPFSKRSRRIRRPQPGVLRQDLDVPDRQSSAASKRSTTEN